jgi:hypothetical protein
VLCSGIASLAPRLVTRDNLDDPDIHAQLHPKLEF